MKLYCTACGEPRAIKADFVVRRCVPAPLHTLVITGDEVRGYRDPVADDYGAPFVVGEVRYIHCRSKGHRIASTLAELKERWNDTNR